MPKKSHYRIVQEQKLLLLACLSALKSYEFGNASPHLAHEVAKKIEEYLGITNEEVIKIETESES